MIVKFNGFIIQSKTQRRRVSCFSNLLWKNLEENPHIFMSEKTTKWNPQRTEAKPLL